MRLKIKARRRKNRENEVREAKGSVNKPWVAGDRWATPAGLHLGRRSTGSSDGEVEGGGGGAGGERDDGRGSDRRGGRENGRYIRKGQEE